MTSSVQIAKQLLKRVSETAKIFEEQYRETGIAYNIFKVIGTDNDEVKTCRVLADLLNPKGLHYRGSIYLKLFMDEVISPLIKKTGKLKVLKALNVLNANVKAQYPIDEERRIDIVIDDGAIFIPIEVKINAPEQPKQLTDYAAFSKKMNTIVGFVPVLFLTKDGSPSKEKEVAEEDYEPISFEKHIIPWLEKCLRLEETDKALPVKEVLKQLINAIKSFCGNEDETMENAINALIAKSRDSYTAALQISNAVNKLERDFDTKIRKIFKGDIYELIKNKIPEAIYKKEGEPNDVWYCIRLPIGHGCELCVDYNMQRITVESDNLKKVDAIADKIRKTMTNITDKHDGGWGGYNIWASSIIKYPGLEDIDNDKIYKYELYRIYSKKPQSVANWILTIANELKNI